MLLKIILQKNLFVEMVLNDFTGMFYELAMKLWQKLSDFLTKNSTYKVQSKGTEALKIVLLAEIQFVSVVEKDDRFCDFDDYSWAHSRSEGVP